MNVRKSIASAVVLGTAVLGGATVGSALLGTAGAQEATTTTPPAATTTDSGTPAGPHTANGTTEAPLTGSDLDKATAAALAQVPGATVVRAETDADGDTYEVHITRTDGTPATVKLDDSFAVVSVEEGGGRGGHGHHGGGGPHSANGITETPLTGADAESATAAAQGAVPGGTVDRVETDADGGAYEAHVTKEDGSHVTVTMDQSFTVTKVEEGGR